MLYIGRIYRVCLLLATLAIVSAIGALAQTTTATISGTVRDSSGAVIPGVDITASNTATGLTRSVVTNEGGSFVIPLLPVGPYEAKAELAGFKTQVRGGLVLQVDQRATVNFTLEVGDLTETLFVTGQAPLVQSESTDIGSVIEQRRVVNLPLNAREFQNLALLVPGAITSAEGSSNSFRGAITIGGSRERNSGFTLDGIDLIGSVVQSVAFKPSVDAIQEFKVQTSLYSADLGRQSGGQVNVTTRSGTNAFHGTVYEFLRNDIFDAKNFFDPADEPKPPYKRNQFGFTIGGPIVRDRTFFFGNYEGLRLRQSLTRTATVPTPAMVAGDFSRLGTPIRDPLTGQPFPGNIIPQARMDSVGRAVAGWYPQPNLSEGVRNFVSTPLNTRRIDQFTVRLDHRVSNNNNIFGRFSLMDDLELDPFDIYMGITNLPDYGRLDDQWARSLSIVDTHVFNPSLIGEFRVGFNRFFQFRSVYEEDQRDIAGELGIPGVSKEPINFGFPTFIPTGYETLGKDGLPSDRTDTTYQAIASLTYTRGNHTLKVGTDIARYLSTRINNGQSRGVFRFSGQYTGNALADMLLGYPRQTQRNLGDSQTGPRAIAVAHYLQDDWRVTPRLTLNLGVRWDWQPDPMSTNDRDSRFNPETGAIELTGNASTRRDIARPDNPLSANYSPELAALAASVTFVDLGRRNIMSLDKNDIAPRLGLAYRVLDNDRLVLRSGYGIFYQVHQLAWWGTGADAYPFKVGQTFNGAATQPNITMANPFPGALASASINPKATQEQLRTPYVQQYTFGLQYQPLTDLLIDVGYVGNTNRKLGESRNINQPLPSPTGSVASRRPYQGFGNITRSENVGNSNYNSLQMRVEKRHSQGLVLMGSYTWSKSIDESSGGSSGADAGLQDHNNRRGNRGLSGHDVRHRLVTSYIYELPFGSGQRFLTDARGFGNWLVSGWEISGISTFQSGFPFTVILSGDNSNTGASSTDRPNLIGNPNLPKSERTVDRWFNTEAFAIPARGTFGNVGRNTMTGPGIMTTDLALLKKSRISEGTAMEFRAEFFNIANRANLGFPNRDANSPQFGTIFTAGTPRQIQLGLKFIF